MYIYQIYRSRNYLVELKCYLRGGNRTHKNCDAKYLPCAFVRAYEVESQYDDDEQQKPNQDKDNDEDRAQALGCWCLSYDLIGARRSVPVAHTPKISNHEYCGYEKNKDHHYCPFLRGVGPWISSQKAVNAKSVSISQHHHGHLNQKVEIFQKYFQMYFVEKKLLETDMFYRPGRAFRSTLQWRHNDHDGVSNLQPYDCLLNCLFRHRSKKTSKLRVTRLCAGISLVTREFPAQRPSI